MKFIPAYSFTCGYCFICALHMSSAYELCVCALHMQPAHMLNAEYLPSNSLLRIWRIQGKTHSSSHSSSLECALCISLCTCTIIAFTLKITTKNPRRKQHGSCIFNVKLYGHVRAAIRHCCTAVYHAACKATCNAEHRTSCHTE